MNKKVIYGVMRLIKLMSMKKNLELITMIMDIKTEFENMHCSQNKWFD